MKHLPPLKAVRAFEACYRLNSFTKAADSLNVGQPAISHQIKILENDLGIKLFEKRGSLLQPTKAADSYFVSVSRSLNSLADASRNVRDATPFKGITIATYPGLAAYWVSPRLAKLHQSSVSMSIRIVTSELDETISLRDVDCAILVGRGDWADAEALPLIQEQTTPVAAPALVETLKDRNPETLLTAGPLIHLEDEEHRWFTWEDWRDRFAPDTMNLNQAVTVSNHALAIHQALTGQGITLAWRGLVQTLVASGSLIELHDKPLVSDRRYWLVARPGFLQSERGTALYRALTSSEV
jgi:LysR family glycine cleavage system transcriptional activator